MLFEVDREELWLRQAGENMRQGTAVYGPVQDGLFVVSFGLVITRREAEQRLKEAGLRLASKSDLLRIEEDLDPRWAQLVCKGYALMRQLRFRKLERVGRNGTWPVYTLFITRRRLPN